ncbi:MAG: porphobilinogen synthase, partial [Candidatus Omnitrophota bacterium]
NHGHCGVLKKDKREIDNKKTLELLQEMALRHAQAGSDWVCPSAMAKKQVFVIRKALDKNGYKNTKILGYSAKFNSNFYGPFRNVANSSPKFGDRSSYQLDYKNDERALDEIKNDILEGANMVMVKPSLSYLDIIKVAKEKFKYPLAAYNTSGEYSLIKYGAKLGLFDERKTVFEIISSIKRAGADFIISYHAKDIAKWLKEN